MTNAADSQHPPKPVTLLSNQRAAPVHLDMSRLSLYMQETLKREMWKRNNANRMGLISKFPLGYFVFGTSVMNKPQ